MLHIVPKGTCPVSPEHSTAKKSHTQLGKEELKEK